MGLREFFGMGRKAPDSPVAPAEPPYRDDACPSCGCQHFQPGPPVVRARSNGVSAQSKPESAMLLCLGCGAAWYGTASGLVEPDERAVPAAWLAVSDRVNARQASEDRSGSKNGARDEYKFRRRVPGPSEGFSRPPKV